MTHTDIATDEPGHEPAPEPAPIPVTYPRAVRRNGDVVHHLVDTGRSGNEGIASVGELVSVLLTLDQGRPVHLSTPDGAGWLVVVRDDHTGPVDLLSRGTQY